MKRFLFVFFIIELVVKSGTAFVSSPKFSRCITRPTVLEEHNGEYPPQEKTLNEGGNENLSLDLRVKAKEEISSPFRKLRQFAYISIGLAGGLGTFTGVPQLFLATQQADGAVTKSALNLLVDVGGIIAAVALWDRESVAEKEKLARFTEREQRMGYQLSKTEELERQQRISLLPVEVQVSDSDEEATRIVKFADLQSKGQQNIIIFAGDYEIVKDAVISARVEGSEVFNMKDTFLLPLVLGETQLDEEGTRGFGSKKLLMEAPYIAKPAQKAVWLNTLQQEIDLAKLQGAEDIEKQGLVLAVSRSGKIVRRGIGLPPWKQVVDEMDEGAK
jgi:hypothetical protein